MAKIENPFRFGSVVTGDSFINRKDSIKFVKDVMSSSNHLVIIAPRRYGKTSLAMKATMDMRRPIIHINMQKVTDEADLARQLVKATLSCYPLKKIKYAFTHFSVVPTISTDPVTGAIEVALVPNAKAEDAIDDAFRLMEEAGKLSHKPIVIMDEFQEAAEISPELTKRLRACMQLQNNVNYILLGSQESMMREIFEKKKSPFYHFGVLLHLPPIPREEFVEYLRGGLSLCYHGDTEAIVNDILDFTQCHPYYTQELAFYVRNELMEKNDVETGFVARVINGVVMRKDYDYERLWARMTGNGKKLMKAIAAGQSTAIYTKDFLVENGFNATSTVRGAANRLIKDGYIVNDILKKEYRVEDPFFQQWLKNLF